jgi:hypothetical protein
MCGAAGLCLAHLPCGTRARASTLQRIIIRFLTCVLPHPPSQLRSSAPHVLLLVTSRRSLGSCAAEEPTPQSATLPEQHVGALGLPAATSLVRAQCPDLSPMEAECAASMCSCVPLVLALVAESLVAGRRSLEVRRLQICVQLPTGSWPCFGLHSCEEVPCQMLPGHIHHVASRRT